MTKTKIVCIGDSLTEGYGLDKNMAWPALLQNRLNITVVNSGISGDTTSGMLARFYPDVIQHRPTHVIISINRPANCFFNTHIKRFENIMSL